MQDRSNLREPIQMNTIRMSLFAAAVALGAASFTTGASAMPFSNAASIASDSLVQDVRLVCDSRGRCYETRGSNRARYAPRDRRHYGHRRGYNDRRGYGYQRSPGIGIGVGPVGVHIR